MKKIFLTFFVFLIMFIVTAKADLVKPNIGIKPYQVVKIQLSGLMKNDEPNIDNGIKQTWEFAHPSNKKFTGPLSRFIKLLNDEGYNVLLNHTEHKVVEIFNSEKKFIYEVTILDRENFFFKYTWQVEKFLNGGPLNNCWLTTSVSLPTSLGSSI